MADRMLAGFLFIAGDKVLLVLSRKDEGRPFGRWSIPKGRCSESDRGDLFATAIRELKEETGIDLGRWSGDEIDEREAVAKGTIEYKRKGRTVVLHYFAIRRTPVVLDWGSANAEVMSGVGFFAPALAMRLIRREQRPIVSILLPCDSESEETGAGLACPIRLSGNEASRPA